QRRYTFETVHPPLARVIVALGPYLDGARAMGLPNKWDEGNAILQADGLYQRRLILARLGSLPFFVIAGVAVACWAYLLGDIRIHGWWYFYPVVLSMKIPIPLLILVAVGTGFLIIKRNQAPRAAHLARFMPLVALLGVVGVGMSSRIDNGTRQVLVVYPL